MNRKQVGLIHAKWKLKISGHIVFNPEEAGHKFCILFAAILIFKV